MKILEEKRAELMLEIEKLINTAKIENRAFTDDEDCHFAQLEQEAAGINSVIRAECKLAELRYNPYHDPTNGRFTTADGGGTGAFLHVPMGRKGKGAYVIASENFTKSGKKYTSDDKTTFEGEPLTDTRRYNVYSSKGFQFKDDLNLYEAKSNGKGELIISQPKGFESEGKYPQRGDEGTYTYSVKSGFKRTSDGILDTGIDWDNVTSVSGKTYDIKDAVKSRGFSWDRDSQSWKKNK